MRLARGTAAHNQLRIKYLHRAAGAEEGCVTGTQTSPTAFKALPPSGKLQLRCAQCAPGTWRRSGSRPRRRPGERDSERRQPRTRRVPFLSLAALAVSRVRQVANRTTVARARVKLSHSAQESKLHLAEDGAAENTGNEAEQNEHDECHEEVCTRTPQLRRCTHGPLALPPRALQQAARPAPCWSGKRTWSHAREVVLRLEGEERESKHHEHRHASRHEHRVRLVCTRDHAQSAHTHVRVRLARSWARRGYKRDTRPVPASMNRRVRPCH